VCRQLFNPPWATRRAVYGLSAAILAWNIAAFDFANPDLHCPNGTRQPFRNRRFLFKKTVRRQQRSTGTTSKPADGRTRSGHMHSRPPTHATDATA
jgi:hypothetical protein